MARHLRGTSPDVTKRQVGVEEEMFLLDPETRLPSPVSTRVVNRADVLEHELFLEQVETQSRPHADLTEVRSDLAAARVAAAESARAAGARLAAVPTPVLAVDHGHLTPKERYRLMATRFGEVGRRALVCGMHVHVDVHSDDEGVGIIDRLRPWLPLLQAMSSNSPFDHGTDTGYASWRAQVWDGWPTAGPVEPFGDATTYHAAVAGLVESGAAVDVAMIYHDVRLAQAYPTVEIRVADVCTELDDAMLVAAVARALVETQAAAWRHGEPVPPWRVDLLQAARWRARRDGLDGRLLDPVTAALVPADEAVGTLLASIEPALRDLGDLELVRQGLDRLLRDGTGASRQRALATDDGGLSVVVDDLIARTAACAHPDSVSR